MPPPSITDGIRSRMVEAMMEIIAEHPTVKTRRDFASAIGTTAAQVSKWQSGVATPTHEDIYNTCTLFFRSVEWIYFGREEKLDLYDIAKRLGELERKFEGKKR